ncbi:hypothetical protein Bca52824_008824 [Brassica carinata]|uniref:Uncharacterized protein n=1 Tax=Brassica carinata TaxID=52824 RepID=A0A8X7WAL7_BRACI|nr:hypothetical protein Bca52824_008824 [Brassica carinata]
MVVVAAGSLPRRRYYPGSLKPSIRVHELTFDDGGSVHKCALSGESRHEQVWRPRWSASHYGTSCDGRRAAPIWVRVTSTWSNVTRTASMEIAEVLRDGGPPVIVAFSQMKDDGCSGDRW